METDINFDSWHEAAQYSVSKSGKQIKQIAVEMWPTKNPLKAQTDLNEILNSNKKRKFSADEHAAFCRVTKQYYSLYYICDKAGLHLPKPKVTDEKLEEVTNAITATQRKLDALKREQEILAQAKSDHLEVLKNNNLVSMRKGRKA